MSFYDPLREISILLVDKEEKSIVETSKLLQMNGYKVTTTMGAANVPLEEARKFDLLIIDVSTSDQLEAYKLFHEVVKMESVVILMSYNPDNTLMERAIEDGAFLFLKKPIALDVIKTLWQHVLKEKMIKYKGRDFEEVVKSGYKEATPNSTRIQETTGYDSGNALIGRKKLCIDWNQEFHERFTDAVQRLGDGRCFPKEILQLMNVPGLTRMQVASHLQKCRQGWEPADKRKPRRRGPRDNGSTSGTKKFGVFPGNPNGSQSKLADVEVPVNVAFGTNDNNIANSENVATLNQHDLLFGLIPFELEVDSKQVVTGINFNPQNIDWDKVDPKQVPNMNNVDGDGAFWGSWIAGFIKR